jgi:hypothetical protein
MTRNLETADRIVKLVMALMTIVLYMAGMIHGPWATALLILSVLVVLLQAIRTVYQGLNSKN